MKFKRGLYGIGFIVGLSVFVPLRAFARPTPREAYPPAQYPERYTVLQELQGTVQKVDPTGGLIYVEDRTGRHWGLTVDDYTTISKTSSKPLRLKDLKAGDPVNL